MDLEAAVRTFMDKHHIDHRDVPGPIPEGVTILRLRLMVEELSEVTTAMHELQILKDQPLLGYEPTLVKLADGLADLLYVVVGTMLAYGLPVNEVFAEVHRSNMTKQTLDKWHKGGKDESFQPPDLLPVIRGGGYRRLSNKDVSGNVLGGE